MADKKSDLPLATLNLDEAKLTLAGAKEKIVNIKTLKQAIIEKIKFEACKTAFKKFGLFEELGFKASECVIEVDRLIYRFVGKSGHPGVTEDVKSKAKKECLTRNWFIKDGQDSIFSKDPEWNTPSWIYERARLIMGSIDLDPATNQEAIDQGNVATRYFTKEDDGLKQDWGKQVNVFCNPPYTLENKASGAKAFLIKLMASDYKQAVFITIEDSGTFYGHFLWPLCTAVFIPKGWVAFSDQNKNTRSSLVWGIGVDELMFWMAFKGLGHVETRYTKNPGSLGDRMDISLSWLKKLKDLPQP